MRSFGNFSKYVPCALQRRASLRQLRAYALSYARVTIIHELDAARADDVIYFHYFLRIFSHADIRDARFASFSPSYKPPDGRVIESFRRHISYYFRRFSSSPGAHASRFAICKKRCHFRATIDAALHVFPSLPGTRYFTTARPVKREERAFAFDAELSYYCRSR